MNDKDITSLYPYDMSTNLSKILSSDPPNEDDIFEYMKWVDEQERISSIVDRIMSHYPS